MNKYIVYCGAHPTAGVIFKIYKYFGEYSSGNSYNYKIGDLGDDNYTHCIAKDFEDEVIYYQEGFEVSMFRKMELTEENFEKLRMDFIFKTT